MNKTDFDMFLFTVEFESKRLLGDTEAVDGCYQERLQCVEYKSLYEAIPETQDRRNWRTLLKC